MNDCIFCKIVNGKIPSDKIMETENVLAIEDRFPKAPKHYLILPKKHVKDVLSLEGEDNGLLDEMIRVVKEVAKKKGLAENGFRLVINNGVNGGQTIFHLHIHFLGGRIMNWPPG